MVRTLTAIKHGRRVSRDIEDLCPESVGSLQELRKKLDTLVGNVGIVIPSHKRRAQNTVTSMGYDFRLYSPELSRSVQNYERVPWKGDFGTVQRSYLEGGPTRELGDYHAEFYLWMLNNFQPDNLLVVTHDTRIESALSSLASERGDLGSLGENLDYGEGCTLTFDGDLLREIKTLRHSDEGSILEMEAL